MIKRLFIIATTLALLSSCRENVTPTGDGDGNEKPQYQEYPVPEYPAIADSDLDDGEGPELNFHPESNWLNDPNGLFWKDGIWHLYYQYDPTGISGNGPRYWGHATSRNLYKWTWQDVAIPADENGYAWSGCCVIDSGNKSGLGKDAVIALYTNKTSTGEEKQSIYFSNDGGYSFTKYPGNPILADNPYCIGFRDPKVIWVDELGKYLMVLTRQDGMSFYTSENLIDWAEAGDYIPSYGVTWECPDLFKMGDKWVLFASDRGCQAISNYSGVRYLLGRLDKRGVFVPDDEACHMLDYGTCFYAAQTWAYTPDDVRVMIAWQHTFVGGDIYHPTKWNGNMTVPRTLLLGEYDGKPRLYSYPVSTVIGNVPEEQMTKATANSKEKIIRMSPAALVFDFEKNTVEIRKVPYPTTIQLEKRESHDVLMIRGNHSLEIFIDGGAVAYTTQLEEE